MKVVLRIVSVILAIIAVFFFLSASSDLSDTIAAIPEDQQAIVIAATADVKTQFILKGVLATIGAFAVWFFSSKKRNSSY